MCSSDLASTIAETDDHDHVISIHQTGGVDFDFPEDPEIDQFAMQTEQVSSPSDLHESTKEAVSRAAGRYHVNMAEDAYQRDLVTNEKREELRKSNWAVAMAGAHLMVWGMWEPEPPTSEMLGDLERLRTFVESTDYTDLEPADDRARGDTDWVLSDGSTRHVAYAMDGSNLGVGDLEAGTYRLEWFDPADGDVHEETVTVDGGDRTFERPSSIGSEAALWIYPEESTTTAAPNLEGPGDLRVSRVHPNPFNNRASVRVAVDRTQRVEIAVYDVLGRRRSLLFDGRLSGGTPRTFDIDASTFPTGWYLLRIRGAEFEVHRTMTLLK